MLRFGTMASVALILLVVTADLLHAQPEADSSSSVVVQAVVMRVLVDDVVAGPDGREQPFQRLEMKVATGPHAGDVVIVDHGQFAGINVPRFAAGDRLLLSVQRLPDGQSSYFVLDAVRSDVLLALGLMFGALVVAVGRWRGIASLLSLALTFVVIFVFILPRIVSGHDPMLTAILGAAVIIPLTFYLSHGLSRKTTAAVVGTLLALAITGAIAFAATNAAKLTGYSSEEALLFQSATLIAFDMRGVLMASIIIGLLGVLDDITVSQAAVVNQLRGAAPDITNGETIRRAMDVGTDHIASLVNTLVLVYASAAMPLLLVFSAGSAPASELVNYELVAEEVIRALVASIGLILAVPITTIVAVYAGVAPAPEPEMPEYHDYLADEE